MKEKIKKILFMKLKPFLVSFLVILIPLIILFACLIVCYGLGWNGWPVISALALIITGVFIGFQAHYTRKHIEISVTPSAFFVLRSLKTIDTRKDNLDLWETRWQRDKLFTEFIVQNNSKSPILFKVKITFKFHNKNKELSRDHYWDNDSLHVYPGRMHFPNVIDLVGVIRELENKKDENWEDTIKDKQDNKEQIIADIKYKYTPRFIEEYSKEIEERWIFHFKNFTWTGPNGISDENIYLPGENQVKKVKKENNQNHN